jgi:CelD/BcsL family acetyltransferase involved in cellulose biosynthesis
MTTLAASLIESNAALAALAPAWRRLWRRAPGATPFQSPDWLLPWWQHFGTARPRVAVLHGKDGTLAGVLPLYELDGRLLPLGAGLTDYQDALLGPDAPQDAAGVLLRTALAGTRLPCELTDVPPEAVLRTAPAPQGWRSELAVTDPCPVLYDAAIPALQRRKLRMARHRAERTGGWRVEAATAATLPAALDALIALHAAAWAPRGAPGVFADPRVAAFHRAAAPALLAAGALRLALLHLGPRPAAAAYTLLAPGRLCFYLGGWNPTLAWHSPGTLLIGAMIEQASAEGRREVHFLRGGEAYKQAWGATDRRNATRRLVPP